MRLPKDQAIAKAVTFKHGGMTPEELGFLYDCCLDKKVIEVGSMVGMSSYVIASAATSLVCVDLWPDTHAHIEPRQRVIYEQFSKDCPNMFEQFLRNMDGCDYEWRRGKSDAVAVMLDQSADIVLIDADHSGAGVKRDISCYLWHLNNPGMFLFHDYGSSMWDEVKPTVDLLMSALRFYPVKTVGYLAAFTNK